MGCSHTGKYCHRLHQFTISCLILVISWSSELRSFSAEGRVLTEIVRTDNSKTVSEEKAILRPQIGSRPPRCDRRCASCGHCEAIQVPTNSQITIGTRTSAAGVAAVPVIAYARGDGNSNYKPMSWKCKCGSHIFNP